MDESYVAALIAVWEDLRAALGERFEALAPELSNLIEAYLTARDTEAAAQAEVAVEDWIAEHAPSLDGAIRLQMVLAMDTPAVSFDLESLTGRTQADWASIMQSLSAATTCDDSPLARPLLNFCLLHPERINENAVIARTTKFTLFTFFICTVQSFCCKFSISICGTS